MKYVILTISILFISSQSKLHELNCEWSTYRPGPYFGLSSSNPSSPLFGLMWYEQTRQDSVKSLRHFVEISDNITTFKYSEHNGCNYASLLINDTEINVVFNISFINEDSHWFTSIDAIQSNPSTSMVLLWYMTHERDMTYSIKDNKLNGDGSMVSMTNRVKDWTYPVYKDIKYDKEYFLLMKIPQEQLFDPSQYVIGELKDSVGIVPNHLIDSEDSYRSKSLLKGNTFVKQIFFKGHLRYDIHFYTKPLNEDKLSFDFVNSAILAKSIEFNQLIKRKYGDKRTPLVKYALSSLNSNMIFMHGQLFILTDEDKPQLRYSKERSMFAIAPDKTSHARGFMWDEGFQLLILHTWNPEKSFGIFTSWFNGIEENGWLAREQSLDNESRARAPPSSWAVIENVANPPSLYLYLEKLIEDNYSIPSQLIIQIEKNAKWFFTSQSTKMNHVYAWKGKTDDYCLPSGLDDYPRSRLNGSAGIEGHLDLQSWLIVISRTMMKVYNKQGDNERYDYWSSIHHNTNQSLYDNYWNEELQHYDDFYYTPKGIKIFSGHLGYINFFPLILSCLNNNSNLIKLSIDLLLKKLETPFGIRSLDPNDSYYRKGQNYWTSPLWVNINYLIVKTLYELSSKEQFSYLAKDYLRIKTNLIDNLNNNFKRTGTLWETYDDITGKGQYNHPFTGWSSLILNIINDLY